MSVEPLTNRVAEIISDLRKTRGISQEQLGEMLGLSQTQVSKKLRGIYAFSLEDVEKLSTALGVSVHELVPS